MKRNDTRYFRSQTRGFSLMELLIAVFVLGIGLIGISALFAAGISQQRQAIDVFQGEMVAENALALLRVKLKSQWFGTMEDFNTEDQITPSTIASQPLSNSPIDGDWSWKRPGFLFSNYPSTPINENGAIDIFSAYLTRYYLNQNDPNIQNLLADPIVLSKIATENYTLLNTDTNFPLCGIPYVPHDCGDAIIGTLKCPPVVLISQEERSYPSPNANGLGSKPPSYYWECMFRRFNGSIQVAIFVYRIGGQQFTALPTTPGTTPRYYVVSQAIAPYPTTVPPLPFLIDLPTASQWHWGGPDKDPSTIVDDSNVVTPDPTAVPAQLAPDKSWQYPGQWILDQYNIVRQVMVGRRTTADGPKIANSPTPYSAVQMKSSYPNLPNSQALFGSDYDGEDHQDPTLRPPTQFIWFIPTTDSLGRNLIPVYVGVYQL